MFARATSTTVVARPAAAAVLQASSFATSTVSAADDAVEKVAVIGAGLMGRGIAQVAANEASKQVTLMDTNQAQLDAARNVIEKLLAKDVKKGKLDQDAADAALARLTTTTDITQAVQGAQAVIEAATEDLGIKEKVLASVFDAPDLPENAIVATNTSSLPITRVAGSVPSDRAHQVVGMHFFNPVPVMPLVEVIPALQTSEDTLARTLALGKAMGKQVVPVVDSPGFVVNRILCPYINEAINVLAEGIATVEDIDKTMRLGTNVPMGPLTLADFVGLDTMLSVMRVFHREFGDDKYRPSPLLVKMVDAGYYGVKSGKGFYDHAK